MKEIVYSNKYVNLGNFSGWCRCCNSSAFTLRILTNCNENLGSNREDLREYQSDAPTPESVQTPNRIQEWHLLSMNKEYLTFYFKLNDALRCRKRAEKCTAKPSGISVCDIF